MVAKKKKKSEWDKIKNRLKKSPWRTLGLIISLLAFFSAISQNNQTSALIFFILAILFLLFEG